METGDISQKLGRGRHTTRQVELFKLEAAVTWRIRLAFPPSM